MSLGTKLTLWVLIPILLVLTGFTIITLQREHEAHQRELGVEAAHIANLLAIPLGEAVRGRDLVGLRRIVEQSALEPDRFGLAVYDAQGALLLTWGLASTARPMSREEVLRLSSAPRGHGLTSEEGGAAVRRHMLALSVDTQVVGAIHVIASQRDVQQILFRERTSFLGMLAVVSVLLVLLTLLAIRRAVTRPLQALMRQITALGQGQAPATIEIPGQDEVARLSREFNALARTLDEARRRLLAESASARGVIQSITDGIIAVDRAGRIRTWNRAMVERYGIPEAEVLGRELFEAFPALAQEGLRPELAALLRGERPDLFLKHFEHETRHRGRVVLNIRGSALRGLADEVSGAVLAIEDVTDRLTLEREVQQAEKLAVVGQLAAGIAHQIGTPLNVISGSAEYLMMEWGADRPRPQELEIIVAQTDRITKLIRQLLNFARPTRMELGPVRMNELLDEVLGLIEHQIAKERISIQTDFQPDLPTLVGDANQLEQAFLNIVVNAWHAMAGGGTLALRTRAVPGGDRLRRGGRGAVPGVEVVIADTGVGIPPEHLPRIFDPFFSTKGVGKGTGLGLAITRRIVEDHHGAVEVSSEVRRGTSFRIWLPTEGAWA
jgi:PAS domain S-box-containing protein